MNAQEYCEMVEKQYRKHKQLLPTISIKENNSRLISLKESGFNLVFESSIKKDYNYMVREDVFDKIGRISKLLDKQDKKLIIRSVWRSFEHQRLLWEDKDTFSNRYEINIRMSGLFNHLKASFQPDILTGSAYHYFKVSWFNHTFHRHV